MNEIQSSVLSPPSLISYLHVFLSSFLNMKLTSYKYLLFTNSKKSFFEYNSLRSCTIGNPMIYGGLGTIFVGRIE